jgi:hypothetical protein
VTIGIVPASEGGALGGERHLESLGREIHCHQRSDVGRREAIAMGELDVPLLGVKIATWLSR